MRRVQPICKGLTAAGELVWEVIDMPRWIIQQLGLHYKGDFAEQWMYLRLAEQGLDWDGHPHAASHKNAFKTYQRKGLGD